MSRRASASGRDSGFWRVLEAVGVKDARRAGERQSPFAPASRPAARDRRHRDPARAALLGLPTRPPSSLLAITYVLYLLPRTLATVRASDHRAHARGRLPVSRAANELPADTCSRLPIFNTFPSMDTMVVMAIFAMMAVGLNIVVGYAGPARPRVRRVLRARRVRRRLVRLAALRRAVRNCRLHVRWSRRPAGPRRDPHLDLDRPDRRGDLTAFGGVIIGLPTLRLRGDYLAIVTLGFGEIIAEVARNGDNGRARLQPHERPAGDQPVDPPGFGDWLSTISAYPRNFLEETGSTSTSSASTTGRRSCSS